MVRRLTPILCVCALTFSPLAVSRSLAAETRSPNSLVLPTSAWGSGCSGYSSQSLPPATINVLLTARQKVVTVPFESYVMDVLPNEWMTNWNPQADEAGAIAVKMYGWYFVTHSGHGNILKGVCYDVTDDQSSQVYVPGSQNVTTDTYIEKTWSIVAWQSYYILDAAFNAGSLVCPSTPGNELYQDGTQECSILNPGWNYQTILTTFYTSLTFSGELAGNSNGSGWAIGTHALASGTDNGIYPFDAVHNVWGTPLNGSAVRIAVGPNNIPWVVNSSGNIYSYNGSGFVQQPGLATDIAVGNNGQVWITGFPQYPPPVAGNNVYSWNGSGWTAISGQVVRIAVDASGNLWGVNAYGGVFEWNGSSWTLEGSTAGNQIAAGSAGEGMINDAVACTGGDGIFQWSGSAWGQLPGCAISIADVGSVLEVVNSLNAIYAWFGGSWYQGPDMP